MDEGDGYVYQMRHSQARIVPDGTASEDLRLVLPGRQLNCINGQMSFGGASRLMVDQHESLRNIIGQSLPLLRTLEKAARIAPEDSTVLIRGETGTGKELLARAIHEMSIRCRHKFVVVNCDPAAEDLVESLSSAEPGTVFLDEVANLSGRMQIKLAQLLQTRRTVNGPALANQQNGVRVLAATKRDLRALLDQHLLREDLYYGVGIVSLELPALRERLEDVSELASFLFERLKQLHQSPQKVLTPAVMSRLASYSWPGNIRELENVLESMLMLSGKGELDTADLPEHIRSSFPNHKESMIIDLPERGISLEDVERGLLLKALEKCGWNQTHTARYLDISRRTLIYRMEKYKLRRD